MNILSLDTALGACSAAVLTDNAVRAKACEPMARGHAERLAPMVQEVMAKSGLSFAELDRLAVTTGPGTFTGQRVGIAFARALALSLKIPLFGVTTLAAMNAEALSRGGALWAIAAADAKRGEIYLSARNSGAEDDIVAPELLLLEDAPARLAAVCASFGADVLVTGTAAELLLPLLRAAGLNPIDSNVRQPDAEFVGRLAAQAKAAGPENLVAVKPLYLRPPDAKLPAVP